MLRWPNRSRLRLSAKTHAAPGKHIILSVLILFGLPLLSILSGILRAGPEAENTELIDRWEYTWSDLRMENGRPDPGRDIHGAPVSWKAWKISQVGAERNGRELLWLRVRLPDFRLRDPAILFDSIDLNYHLYTDSGLRHSYGTQHPDGRIDFRGWPWHLISLEPADSANMLYLRVVSDYRDIGIWHHTWLGERSAILRTLGIASLDRIILGTLFLAVGGVSLLIFALNRRWKEAFYFGCISGLSGIAMAADPGNFVRLLVWNRADRWMQIEYAAGFAIPALYALFFSIIFPTLRYRRFFYPASLIFAITGIIATVAGFINIRWLIQANEIYNILVSIGIVLFLAILIQERHQPDVRYLLIGFAIQAAAALVDIAKTHGMITTDVGFVKYGYTGFLLFMVFFVSHRLVRINQLLENYSRALERRKEELRQSNSRLLEINRLKNEFLSRLSLEFRLPIGAIVNLTASLVQRPGLSESDRRYIDFIHRTSDRLERLVESIRTLSRLQNSDLDLNRQRVDAISILRHAARIFQSYSPGISVIFPEPGGRMSEEGQGARSLPPVLADPLRLQQIFFDILGFLSSWQPRTNLEAQAHLDLRNETTSSLVIRFTRHSRLPEERRSIAFEPFLNLPDPSLPVPVPTLNAARQLAELHGGALTLKTPHPGSTICELTLPVSDGPPAPSLVGDIERRADIEKDLAGLFESIPSRPVDAGTFFEAGYQEQPDAVLHSVLLVESDPSQLFTLFTSLEERRYAVTAVATGEKGLQCIAERKPDLVIVSAYLSDMTGMDFAHAVRKQHARMDLPILAIQDPGSVTPGRGDEPFNDHLFRPVQASEMASRVALHLSVVQAMREHLRFLDIERDLALVQQIQERLLPERKPHSTRFETAITYVPAESVSGDIYDFHALDDNTLCIFLADVTGHGLPAAMLASMVKVAFVVNRDLLLRPDEALQSMNRLMLSLFQNQLFTACLLLLDFRAGQFRYARAGHPPLILQRGDTRQIEELLPRGRVMGIEPDLQSEVICGDFSRGDRFFLYTDGVTELRNPHGGFFDFPAFLKRHPDASLDTLNHALLEELMGWKEGRHDGRPDDDMTSVMIEISDMDEAEWTGMASARQSKGEA